MRQTNTQQYASFGQRFIAMIIDNIVFTIVLSPIFMALFDAKQYTKAEAEAIIQTQGLMGLIDPKQMLFQQVVVLAITLFFWVRLAGTPGKRIMKIKVIDANTGKNLTPLQSVVRYLGYFISAFPMFIGFVWIFTDQKKQGWHDKLANSVVVKDGFVVTPQDSTSSSQNPQRGDSSNDDKDDTFAA